MIFVLSERRKNKMKFARKLRRKNKKNTRCCGEQMTYKDGYGYVCEKCGKVKEGAKNEM